MQRILYFFALFTLFAFLPGGCANRQIVEQPAEHIDSRSFPPFDSPVTFTGSIPCDDCLQVDITLNIRPDGIYQLRKTYRMEQGKSSSDSQMGKWLYRAEGKYLILGKEMGRLKTYVLEDLNRLSFVEWQGNENDGQIQYELTRAPAPAPFDDIVKIRGMFAVSNRVATLMECSSQVTFPLSPDGDFNTALQHYMNTPHDADRPLLVSILGRLVQHNREELVIEQFRKFYPDSDCRGNKVKTSLTGTHWQLIEIQGRRWSEMTDRAAHLLLKQDKSMEGFSGCNKISGTFLVKGDVLLINREPLTRIACPGSMEGENRLISVLDDVESYRIEEDILELIDQNDQVLAKFLAGP